MQVTTSNNEVTVEIQNVPRTENEHIIDQDQTVVNIEEEQVNTTNINKNDIQRKYWVMFWGSRPQNPPPQQSGWCPWSYLPGTAAPPPPQKPPPLAYKPETRNEFVKLVLSIVLIMILLTALFIAYVLMTPDVKEFFQESSWSVLLPALALLMIVDYGFMCSPCTRQMPCNMIFLFLAMVGMSILSAKVTAHYRTEVVLYATLATAATVFVCVLLACSKFDFTKYLLFVIVITTALSVVILIVLLVKIVTGTMMTPIIIAILAISSVLQCVILTIQLQTILGGRAVQLSETDYALGAFMIYTSIIDIFLKMVQIIGISEQM